MDKSILTTIKNMLGIQDDYDHFDKEIIPNINTVLMTLNQIGVGPSSGFSITSKTEKWEDLLGERDDLTAVQSFVYLSVKLMFDPPSNSFTTEAIHRTIKEIEWRLNVQAEGGKDIGG